MSCNPGTPCYSTKVVYPTGCNTNHPCGVKKITTDNVVYSGSNLPCSGINTCDTLTVVIQKIDTFLCKSYICEVLAQCSTTTTTTTTILPFTCNPCVTYLLINTTSVNQSYSWTDCYGVVYSDYQIGGDQVIQICVCEGSLTYDVAILAYPIGAGCHPVEETTTTTTSSTTTSSTTTTTTTTIPPACVSTLWEYTVTGGDVENATGNTGAVITINVPEPLEVTTFDAFGGEQQSNCPSGNTGGGVAFNAGSIGTHTLCSVNEPYAWYYSNNTAVFLTMTDTLVPCP
jgi:hypothetical protein